MTENSADPCPPDAENNTLETPAPRAAPLQHSDKADAGCLVLLIFGFVGVFFVPVVVFLGGAPIIIPVLTCFLLVLATPFINPAERMGNSAKWCGRILTFLLLAGLVTGLLLWLRGHGDQMMDTRQEEAGLLPEAPGRWS